MRVIVTGTVGLDKVPYLEKVRELVQADGRGVEICHIGRRMYEEAPDVKPGRILDLPLSRLHLLRRTVIKDILNAAEQAENVLVNTHATFRWRHGLFPAFDFDQLSKFDADYYICLLDSVDTLQARLEKDHEIDHSLKDLLVWREEETLGTEIMMMGCNLVRQGKESARFYALAIGRDNSTARMLYRLLFRPEMCKAYLSFPMTHVTKLPDTLAEIDKFRRAMEEHFIIFDPGDLEEQDLYVEALEASQAGHKVIEREVLGQVLRFDVAEIMQVAGDIHAQIYARDFMLIDQSDMIISYIPEMPGGQPGLSSGVERELQHAHEATREVYIIWQPRMQPSPFVTETATKIFTTVDESLDYFRQRGYIKG